jgi:hypothetical protein
MKIMRALSSCVHFAGYRLLAPVALLGALASAGGCTASASTSSSDNSCGQDDSVSCAGGAQGYSCNAGDPPPDASDSSLVCSEPTTVGNADTYCCYSYTVVSGATCEQDDTVSSGCSGDSYGFSCTGSDTPDQDFGSNLNCSAPTSGTDAQGAAASLYCCTD